MDLQKFKTLLDLLVYLKEARLPYKKLIENEQRKQYTITESVEHNRWLEAKQGTFSFEN